MIGGKRAEVNNLLTADGVRPTIDACHAGTVGSFARLGKAEVVSVYRLAG